MGLALPDATEIVSRLRKEGMDLPQDCLTVDQAADAIAAVFGK